MPIGRGKRAGGAAAGGFLTPSRAAVGGILTMLGCGVVTGRPIDRGASPSSGAPDGQVDPLADGLVAYWRLDEASSSDVVIDSSGNDNIGVTVGGAPPSASVPSTVSGDPASRAFDGVAQYVAVGNPAVLNFAGPITLAAWVNLVSVATPFGVVVAHGYRFNPSQEVSLRLGAGPGGDAATGTVPYWAAGAWDGSDHAAQVPVDTADYGAWIHLAGVFDGSAWHLYKNGAEVAHQTSALGATSMAAPWAIGARAPSDPATTERYFHGLLDEVRIYRRALAAAEVAELYRR